MTTALVTGASGFVGPYLTRLLEAEGVNVVGFDLVNGQDVRNYEHIRLAVEHFAPDMIFHLAAMAYVPESSYDPIRAIETNVTGTLNVLEAVRNTGSSARVHIAGTSEEYGYSVAESIDELTPTCPTTPYGVTKLAASGLADFYVKQHGLNVVVTRAFNHTGPGHSSVYAVSSFAKRVAEVECGRSKFVSHGNLTSLRNYTDVRDIVRAYRLVIDLPSGIYNVCSGVTVSMQEILDTLCELATTDIPTEQSDVLYRPTTSRFPATSYEKLRVLTNWKPEITLRQTLEDTLNYWRGRV